MKNENIFRRYELKYIVSKEQMERLKSEMGKYMVNDEHGKALFAISTTTRRIICLFGALLISLSTKKSCACAVTASQRRTEPYLWNLKRSTTA